MAKEWSRQRLRNGRMVGAWTSFGHPSITEIFAGAGVDFIGIDLEHSTISQEQAQRIIAAAHSGGIACLPRLAWHSGEEIKRLLDSGADGLIIPNVATVAEIERIVDWSKYPPLGRRAYGIARAQGYGVRFDEYSREWNVRSTLIVQIESVTGVEAAADLLGHPEVDGAMIGPYDLSGSFGIAGRLDDPRVLEASRQVVAACRQYGKACGTHLIDPTADQITAAFSAGYTFVVLGSDVFVLWKWSERMRGILARLGTATTAHS